MENQLNFNLHLANLKNARNALLRLHKILLEHEKEIYEAEHGKISNTGEYFNLVLNDAAFAWLREMSGLIVEIDTAIDAKTEPLTGEKILILIEQIRRMTDESGTNDFARKYRDALEQSSNAIFEHIQIRQNLGSSEE